MRCDGILPRDLPGKHFANVDEPFPTSAVNAQNNLNKLEAQTMTDLQTVNPDANAAAGAAI